MSEQMLKCPKGWEIGYKKVPGDRRPWCALQYQSAFWLWLHIAESLLGKRAGRIVYEKGSTHYAKNLLTGKTFKSAEHLKSYRERKQKEGKTKPGLSIKECGPGIHIFIDPKADWDRSTPVTITVAYKQSEIVAIKERRNETRDKILVVYCVKVLS